MNITIDVKLQLLAGLPIEVTKVKQIRPLKLKEIIKFGYSNYLEKLNILTLTKDKLLENLGDDFVKQLPNDINEFDIMFSLSEESMQNLLKECLEFFLEEKITNFPKEQCMMFGSEEDIKLIHRKNYSVIKDVILLQNYILPFDDDVVTPKNEKAKIVSERMKKAKDEVKRIKTKEQGEMESDFFDMVSAISSKSYSLNKIDVMELTMFQIYEEYKRLSFIDQYHVNIQAMLQGAKNIKLQHWSNKIKN